MCLFKQIENRPSMLRIWLTDEKIAQFELQGTMLVTDSDVTEVLSKGKQANNVPTLPLCVPYICSN